MKLISMFFIIANLLFLPEDSILPKNESGNVYFEEAVEVENRGKEELFNNAVKYISLVKMESKRKNQAGADYSAGIVNKQGSFYVYTQGLITPQIHGEIKYHLTIEVFDEGYKYTFTDFVFQYYQRNRYGIYAPVRGKTKPLEAEKFAGMQKTWDGHKATTKDYIENQISLLKSKMEEMPAGVNSVNSNQGSSSN